MKTPRLRPRVLSAVTVLTASSICVLCADQRVCNNRMTVAYETCMLAKKSDGSYKYSPAYCAQAANNIYNACMQGASGETNVAKPPPLPPNPRPIRPPTTVGNLPPPSKSPPPLGTKPIHPVTGPVTAKGPTPSSSAPTLLAKPKSTPPPHRDHHDH
jgi:hypothetical protein